MPEPSTDQKPIVSKSKSAALWVLRGLAVLIVWCGLMAIYTATYNAFENNAVPVSLGFKDFIDSGWDNGYFRAKGSFENQSALQPGDQLPLQSNVVTCDQAAKACTIATADVFDRYLDLDVSTFDISSWTGQEITFSDDTPICVTNSYVINRAAKTMTLIVRKRAVIPDYAAKSELHPCDNIQDQNIDLADGFKVYWRKRTEFEARNGIYFHLALAAIHVVFIGAIVWLWRKRKSSPRASIGADATEPLLPTP
jgi:hypothetical protein